MTMAGANGGIDAERLTEYERDGFTVLRGAIDRPALDRFEAAMARHPLRAEGTEKGTWPEPGRYMLVRSAMEDPELAAFTASPAIVEPMRGILRDDPKLMMFAIYDRTPGGPGIAPHHDYKRWRPIGSSMRWAFAIVPLSDWTTEVGALELARGSHRVAHPPIPGMPVVSADRPHRPGPDDFVDPDLRRGDIVIVDMHTWHRAGPNGSDRHRAGLFTKWAAASAPPATGWYLFTDGVRRALGPAREHVLATSSDRKVTATRALLERRRDERSQVMLLETERGLELPGGAAEDEGAIPDWDRGNYVHSLQLHLDALVKVAPPWFSYIADHAEGDGLCRVYGHRLSADGWGIAGPGVVWLDHDELSARQDELAAGYELDVVREWERTDLVRGKAVSEALARVDQFAC